MTTPSAHWQQNERINAQILAYGPALFEAVRQEVFDKATLPAGQHDRAAHGRNQAALTATVAQVCEEARWKPAISKAAFWSVAWERIVYQGTRAGKASVEIESMRERIPLFADHTVYDKDAYRFDADEWERFCSHWKQRFAWHELVRRACAKQGRALTRDEVDGLCTADGAIPAWSGQTQDAHVLAGRAAACRTRFKGWLQFAKAQCDWEGSLAGFAQAGTEAIAIMTKSGAYEGVAFSAHAEKMEKYVAIADFLAALDGDNALDHYTGRDYVHCHELQTGEAYRREKERFWEVQARFEAHFGNITALHLMMDLGFKTVKPDRVIAWLFSQLGWLQTLPATLSHPQVIAAYNNDAVVQEVLYRADVMAAALGADASGLSVHRLLDIWFVKYGQEPEARFGVATRLEGRAGTGLKELYEGVRARGGLAPVPALGDAAGWPAPRQWKPIARKARSEPASSKEDAPRAPRAPQSERGVAVAVRKIREVAEQERYRAWKEGRNAVPPMYPARIDDAAKEAVLQLIMNGVEAHAALRQVLGLDGGAA